MTRRVTAASAALFIASAGLPLLAPASAAQAATVTYYRPSSGVLKLAGHGYGHGHGMSQWGAYGGAQSGNTYRQILDWYYGSPAYGTSAGVIKVQITEDGRNSDGTYDARVKPGSGLTALDQAGHTLALPSADAKGTSYDGYRALLRKDGTFRVQAHAGSTWTSLAPSAAGSTVTSWTGWVRLSSKSGVLNVVRSAGSNELYREVIELDRTSSGTGVTVNRLSLDHYLAGVVTSEMPCSWTPTVAGSKRLDALEAQAVAARSYAAWRRQHPRTAQVDIVDSTSDQAYHGFSAERTAASACPWTNADGSKTGTGVAAVAATAGQVMVDANGNPIFAQYSASSGGYETSGGQPYLPSRPDAWDGVPSDSWSSHSWTDSVTAGQLQSAYPAIGSFTSLAVTAREAGSGVDQNGHTVSEEWGGRITRLTVNGSAGSVTTTGASFASSLGLMSPWFTVVVSPPGAPAGVSAAAGDAQATVRWSAPADDGGGGIRGYTITATPSIPPVSVPGTARSAVVTGLSNDRSYTLSVAASNSAGTGAAAAGPAVTPSARVLFHPLPPARILDTHRTGGAIGAGTTRSLRVVGVGGVPSSGVVDVALNIVSVDSTAASYLVVRPHAGRRPASAQLSWVKGQRVNTLVWVKAGPDGTVDVTNARGSTQLLVDVEGYYGPAASDGDAMTATAPTKVFDSRWAHHAVAGGAVQTIPIVGRAGVPSTATAVVVSLTALHPAKRDYVRAWSAGAPRPRSVALYAPMRTTTSATAVLPLTASGAISLSPIYPTHLAVSVDGWFAPAAGSTTGVTSLVTPTRRLVRLSLPANTTRTLRLPLPDGAAAGLLTLVSTGRSGTPVTVWPTGGRMPSLPSMILRPGTVRTSTVMPAGSGAGVSIRNAGRATIQVVVDAAGWA